LKEKTGLDFQPGPALLLIPVYSERKKFKMSCFDGVPVVPEELGRLLKSTITWGHRSELPTGRGPGSFCAEAAAHKNNVLAAMRDTSS
jgi:hypothetical protein